MEQLLTIRDASEFLSTSPSTLYRLCSKGSIPHIKKTFGIRLRQKDLLGWLESDSRKTLVVDTILKNALTISTATGNDRCGGCEMPKGKSKTRLNYGYGAVYIRETKSGSPRFYADYRNKYGKRIQQLIKHAKCWQEARDWLKSAVLKELYSECGIQEKKEPVTLKSFVGMFMENYSKPNKRSWKDDQYRLNRAVRFFGEGVYLNRLHPQDFEKLKAALLIKAATPSTVNTYLRVLKRMYNIAIDWGYAQSNPLRKVRMFSEAEAQRNRVLSHDEESRLFKAASEVLRPIMHVALNTGMRRGEILNLKWEDVDLENGFFSVKKTKSGKPRTVPINSKLMEILMKLHAEKRSSSFVFTSPKTGMPYKTMRKGFEDAREKAELENFRFHDLRRTFGSRLALAGVDLNRIKELLGHSSIKTTEIYLHADSKDIRAAVEILCKEQEKTGEKRPSVLHIRYTENTESRPSPVTSLFSKN